MKKDAKHMKHKLTEVSGGTFVPFELTITVETRDEAMYLWHLFNHSRETIMKSISAHNMYYVPDFDKVDTYELWRSLDIHMISCSSKNK